MGCCNDIETAALRHFAFPVTSTTISTDALVELVQDMPSDFAADSVGTHLGLDLGGLGMTRKVNAEEFARYAQEQIASALSILGRHRAAGGGFCSCARQWPCSVATTCTSRVDHYRGKLALIEMTVALPIVSVARPAATHRGWLCRLFRTLLGRANLPV